MNFTAQELVHLQEQKEQLRQICNRYLESTERLPVDCTLQDIIDVFNEYDEYSYMNAYLNSIEVFPDKDYSINDTEGHIKGLRDYALYKNTALKSLNLPAIQTLGTQVSECTNLEIIKMPSLAEVTAEQPFSNCKTANLNFPKLYSFRYGLAGSILPLKSILIGGKFSFGYIYIGGNQTTEALILTNQNGLSTLSQSACATSIRDSTQIIVYVPAALQTQYASATNWTTINASRPIQDIESHINSLRELGADFSYTPYANKKWENNQLVTDSTIGEEVDS